MTLCGPTALQEFRRRQTRKPYEFADQMRLIEVAGCQGQLGPVAWHALSGLSPCALESPDTAEDLRRHADLFCEKRDKTAMAQFDLCSNAVDARICSAEPMKRKAHFVTRQDRPTEPLHEFAIQYAESRFGVAGCTQAFENFSGSRTPYGVQVRVGVAQRSRRHAKERKGAARPEVNTDERGVRRHIDDEVTALRARDNGVGIGREARRFNGIADAVLPAVQVEDDFERTAWNDVHAFAAWRIADTPIVIDVLRQRWVRPTSEVHAPSSLFARPQ